VRAKPRMKALVPYAGTNRIRSTGISQLWIVKSQSTPTRKIAV